MIPLLLIACVSDETPLTTWTGYVYQQSIEESNALAQFENGNIDLLDESGLLLAQATKPNEDTPFYWQFELEESQLNRDIAMRISGETTVSMLWKGQTPSTDANWLSGGLFTQEIEFTKTYFDAFANGITTVDLNDNSLVHLWGQPLVAEEWIGSTISVFDGNGEPVDVHAFSQLSNGAITADTSTGVIWFFAWNIVPGEIILEITTADGQVVSTSYPSQGGDILSATFYALPEVEE
jgi:hypothetical protein